jgi:hypothetical protein
MKKYILFFILIILSKITLLSQNFYDIATINTIEITFAESNWDALLDQYVAAGEEERLLGTVFINGEQFDSCGVRYKGNSTYNSSRIKNPLNIALDEIISGQEIEGYSTIKLANCFKDPSFIREVMSWEIARNYMPASQANYAKVYINGTYLGLYSNVQSVDKELLGTYYENNDSSFFKGELTNDSPQNLVAVWDYLGSDSIDYYNFYEMRSDYSWNDLINFLDIFNNNPDEIETVFNIDQHLWMLAFDILMVNLDAPINFAHNYYLYKDNNNRFNPLLWDLNENFGVFSMLLDGSPLNTTGLQQLDIYLNSTNSNYPIVNKVLSNTKYKKIYLAHLQTIIDEYFSNDLYHSRALEIQEIIDTEVQNDANKFYTYANFLSNISTAVGSGPQSVIGITQLMDARINYISSLADFQVTKPTIANVQYPENFESGEEIWITAEILNADIVKLSYRENKYALFNQVDMFDDGAHNDGISNDNIYGCSISPSANLQFYIYTENDAAVSLSPVRAEFEYYTSNLYSTTGVAINEVLASNTSIMADEMGEFDDWIELYNNNDFDVSLTGYYMSDKASNLIKWPFPDTLIHAYGYLIIWADENGTQPGLHANFKLSGTGEDVFFVSPSSTIFDYVTFGTQTTDISFGRYVNGTGNFISMTPTFAAQNNNGVSVEEINSNNIVIYPNPAGNYITIESENSDLLNIEILDITGKGLITLKNSNKIIDISWLKSGIYFIRINEKTLKFVKQ